MPLKDGTTRSQIEQRFNVKSCYMRGVRASAKISRDERRAEGNFIMYSALCHKSVPLATVGPDDTVVCRHISPFWAVMLAGRDTGNMVNMVSLKEEYKYPEVNAKKQCEINLGTNVVLFLPFLTNKRDLVPGDLLVLPFDGGLSEICCEAIPPVPEA